MGAEFSSLYQGSLYQGLSVLILSSLHFVFTEKTQMMGLPTLVKFCEKSRGVISRIVRSILLVKYIMCYDVT